MRSSFARVAPFVAAVLLTASAALSLVGASPVAAPATRTLVTPPAEQVVPVGSVIVDAGGAVVEPLTVEVSGGEQVVALPLLEPGRYYVLTPAPFPGGGHTPAWSSFVVAADVVPGDPQPPAGGLPRVAVLLLAVALGALVGALRGPLRLVAFAVVAAGWLLFAITGSSGVGVLSWVASGLALAAVGVVVAAPPAATLASRGASALLSVGGLLLAVGVPLPWSAVVALGAWSAAALSRVSGRAVPVLLAVSTAGVVAATVVPAMVPATWSRVDVTVEQCAELLRGGEREVGLECYRALGARVGAGFSPAEASPEVLRLAGASEGVDNTQVCRQMGQAMSAAAARWGPGRDDPRSLFVSLPPVCDYSSMHGIAPGVFATTPKEDLKEDVVRLCSDSTPDEARLADYEYKAQCWQGAGIMLARKFAFDPALFEVCALAPDEGITNCADGVFRELVDQTAREEQLPLSQFVPDTVSVASLCEGLTGSLVGGCYRYVGEEAEFRAGTTDKTVGVDAILDVCSGGVPQGHEAYCWYAVGMILVRAYPTEPSFDLLDRANEACEAAPPGEPFAECHVGAANAVLNRDRGDVDIDRVCAWFPASDRERLCKNARFYYGHLVGSDSDAVRKP